MEEVVEQDTKKGSVQLFDRARSYNAPDADILTSEDMNGFEIYAKTGMQFKIWSLTENCGTAKG